MRLRQRHVNHKAIRTVTPTRAKGARGEDGPKLLRSKLVPSLATQLLTDHVEVQWHKLSEPAWGSNTQKDDSTHDSKMASQPPIASQAAPEQCINVEGPPGMKQGYETLV